MHVAGLWRYPVKSMQGERSELLEVDETGAVGDRSFGVLDLGTGTVLSAKREGRLLEASARREGADVRVRVPGRPELEPGTELDAALSSWLGRRVRLVGADPARAARFESSADFEDEEAGVVTWEGVPGSLVDSSPLHLLTTGELADVAAERPDLGLDVRRFRPNVLVAAEGPLEPGARYGLGGAVVEVVRPCSRCVVTTRAQPGGIGRELEVLRHLAAVRSSSLGVLARVVARGGIRDGDRAHRAP
ncbi:MAG: MOSC N-terminal beta barrel domain-containing protein [Actinomycetota bacterium]|nr:MOSC N-terminal beta barrel domain-containing protein [Actinomycetota bacterium]